MLTYLEQETKAVIGGRTIAFAKVKVRRDDDTGGYDDFQYFCLTPGYSSLDLQNFWNDIRSYDYDNGYGEQYVFGFIVFTDGTWLERMEYDGSEWWALRRAPVFTDYV